MAFVTLLFDLAGKQSMLGSIPLDALLTEETELTASVSKYAVEDGSVISDHIAREPETLSLSGVITAASIYTFFTGGRSKLIAAKDALRQIHERRQPITIVTGADIYQNYAMTKAAITRKNEGEKLDVVCNFQKIVVARLRQADIPADKVAPSVEGKAGQTGAAGGKVSDTRLQTVPSSNLKVQTGSGT
ncbi:hypothetical protein JQS35_12595 [Alcaligenes faecalis subsp. faecalis]|uniref:phage baseplate protein n=1 Tax=Alcaligenes faecalis TaxID=511 RepID=UPI001F318EA4|nr:hypothetical protein [Alcaligenes faecalis]MBW4789442.1 hypothetical protein [Alcaligenes faecalis subsp. faecalis]